MAERPSKETPEELSERLAELEALIFVSDGPATTAWIRRALPKLTPSRIAKLIEQINESLRKGGRPYEIVEVAGGYQFRTRPEFAEILRRAQPDRTARLSRAALETLAVVAYRQPLTRAEVEEVRSVDCGAVLRGLLERELVRIAGRRDAPGRPALYATTPRFLEAFGLRSLADLPPMSELRDRVLEPSAGADAEEGVEDEGERTEEAATDEPEPHEASPDPSEGQ
jgi:segregation and condensation protein B